MPWRPCSPTKSPPPRDPNLRPGPAWAGHSSVTLTCVPMCFVHPLHPSGAGPSQARSSAMSGFQRWLQEFLRSLLDIETWWF
jgi:hypothetical protein